MSLNGWIRAGTTSMERSYPQSNLTRLIVYYIQEKKESILKIFSRQYLILTMGMRSIFSFSYPGRILCSQIEEGIKQWMLSANIFLSAEVTLTWINQKTDFFQEKKLRQLCPPPRHGEDISFCIFLSKASRLLNLNITFQTRQFGAEHSLHSRRNVFPFQVVLTRHIHYLRISMKPLILDIMVAIAHSWNCSQIY